MLQLVQPIWLIAMAGIAFPVIIHWWNNKQGKVLPVGSIAFLERGSRKQARSRKLSEWWLLLLRCLLLLLMALLLSGPFWHSPVKAAKAKGWVLGVKEDMQAPAYKPLIDSLLKTGYERHEWKSTSYWDLFGEADRAAPADIPFYVFTSGRRKDFTGKRPVSDRIVFWFTDAPSADSIRHWIGQAWLCTPDSIRVLTGSSRPTGTTYTYQMLEAKPAATGPVAASGSVPDRKDSQVSQGICRLGSANGILSVSLDSQPPVTVDTVPLRIRIYADSRYSNDSRYLTAALHALQQFTRGNIQVAIAGIPPVPPENSGSPSQAGQVTQPDEPLHSDWAFWLSSAPVPPDLLARNIICYEPGRGIPVDTWIQGMTEITVGQRVEPDSSSRTGIQGPSRINEGIKGAESSAYPVIWKDGFGRPILSLQTGPGRRVFHFFSHFDPAWNGLVWSPRFPILLQELLAVPASPADRALPDQDRRVLDPAQILPQRISSEEAVSVQGKGTPSPAGSVTAVSAVPPAAIDLSPACWILIFLFFLAERMLSLRSPKIKSYG